MSNQWSNKLRKRMEMHQEPSPQGLWDDIEKIMLAEEVPIPTKEPKRMLLWAKRISAVAILLLLALSIGYITLNDNITDTQQIAEKKSDETEKKSIKEISATQHIAEAKSMSQSKDKYNSEESSNTLKPTKEVSPKKKTLTNHSVTDKNEEENTSTTIVSPMVEEKEVEQKEQQTTPIDKSGGKNLFAQKSNSLAPESDFNSYKIRKPQQSKWGTNLYASNLTHSAANKQGGYTNLSAYKLTQENYEGEMAVIGNAYGNVLLANQYSEVYTDVKHKQPIVIGASANYNIDEKWSVRTGVTYSYLSSKLHSGSDNSYYASDQSLHFIGIPANINYTIWDNQSLKVYASAGGMMEKNVSGKLTTDYIVNNQLEHTKKENVSINSLQWSANAAAGIQYNITKLVGLYFEPGVSYHFDNNSKIETIYKEKPFNLSLRLGLSFSLGGE